MAMSGVAFFRKSTNSGTEGLSLTLRANEDCMISQSSSESPSFFPFVGLSGLSPSMIFFITAAVVLHSGNGTCPVNT